MFTHRYDNEEEVGLGIKDSGVPRKDIWITSKVRARHQHSVVLTDIFAYSFGTVFVGIRRSSFDQTLNPQQFHRPQHVQRGLEETLRKLDTDYLDLYLYGNLFIVKKWKFLVTLDVPLQYALARRF